MEEPNNKSRVRLRIDRWDSPLFIVNFEQDIPLKDVVQAALFDPKKAKDPISTKQDLLKTGNFVHDLDKTLQRILDVIIERQNSMMLLNGGMERVMLEVCFGEAEAKLRLKRMVPVGQLKQFKADFLKMNKQNPFLNLDKVTSAFIGYIQSFEDDY
jgi:tRNA uridine 5-carbamoylmethylation protein Kti12